MSVNGHAPAQGSRVVAVGASAGGVEALSALAAALPATFAAPVLVVLHVSPEGTSVLARILDRAGPLPAVTVRDGMPFEPGRVHVAPPDRHALLEGDVLRLSAGPRENGHRPAIDPSFRALAAFGDRAIGVLLSGTRDDGTHGLARIKGAGGSALVQDPDEALYDGMIRSALDHVPVDGILSIRQLAAELTTLSRTESPVTPDDDTPQNDLHPEHIDQHATRYTCPECGGALWRNAEDAAVSYRCSVGHAYSPTSLDGEQARDVEAALWAAARLLGDRHALLEELATRAADGGHERTASGFTEQAREVAGAADAIRRLIEGDRVATVGETDGL